MSSRHAHILLLTAVVGCSARHVDLTGDGGVPLPPTGATPPLAGATMVSTGTSDVADGVNMQLRVDASGNPLVVWRSGKTDEFWAAQQTSSGWAPAGLVGKDSGCGGDFDFSLDADGNATVLSCTYFTDSTTVHQIWRASAGGGWSAIAPQTGGIIVPGPHGALLHAWTQFVMNPDTSQSVSILANQYDAASGWSANTVLTKFSSAPYGSADGKVLAASIVADGSALATWSQSITPPNGNMITEQLYFATRTSTGTWAAAKTVTYPNVSTTSQYDHIFTDAGGDAIWLAIAAPTANNAFPSQMQSMTFVNGAWSPMQTFQFDNSVTLYYSAAVGSGGAVDVVSTSRHGLTANFETTQSAWQQTDTNAQDVRYEALDTPQVAVDGQGNVVVGWVATINLMNPHIYVARFSPASGWTAPVMVDGNDNPGLAGAWALGTNDAGHAFIAWVKNGALWSAPIP